MDAQHQIFISYHRDDADLARRIREHLVARGARTWMDAYDIPPGAYWPDAIDRGLEESDIVIGILSSSALTSRNVKNEWDWAIENQKQLALVRTEQCVLPHRYVSINLIDVRVRYARSGDISIAYQVVGDGPIDIVMVPGYISHVEHIWRDARFVRLLDRLASSSRLILFDKRGTGLSDRIASAPLPEDRMDDIRAVMDDAQSESAVIFGQSEGASIACLFAASHPDRVRGLIIFGGYATDVWKPDYTWSPTLDERIEQIETEAQFIHQGWGTLEGAAAFLHRLAPSARDDPSMQQWLAKLQREGASPGAAIALQRMNLDLDVRHVLPTIRMPALVIHRTGDRMCHVEGGRYIAKAIPDARFLELPGEDHLPWIGDVEPVVDAIEEFLRERIRPASVHEAESVLATFLFVDFSDPGGDATAQEAARAAARHLIGESRGRCIDVPGPALVASFDGPVRAIRCAGTVRALVDELGTEGRFGLHTGETVLGSEAVESLPIQVAREVAQMASAGEILVTQTVKDLVAGAGTAFADRGSHTFSSLSEAWKVHAVEQDDRPSSSGRRLAS
jgi:pimeloyl-ACP methyl ester carboxylesterase/class 3 adenylate cyclase